MKFQRKRFLTQILIFLSANLRPFGVKTGFCFPFFYCNACPAATSACPLRALELSVFENNFKWKLFTYPLLILGFVGVLTGRGICAWACPIGLLQRLTAKVARKIKKIPLAKRLGHHPLEHYLRYAKYFVLIGFVFLTSALIGFMFTDICPIGFLTGTLPTLSIFWGKFVPSSYFLIASIIFILFTILIFTIERGWCRYFCPLGALLAPFNKISLLHVARVEEKTFQKECLHCNACSNICPMGIDVIHLNRDPECILCGKCIEVCPKDLIRYEK
jgi:ferredoxin-type protein NapH